MTITQDLEAFYDVEAKKYAQTRKKPRKEAKLIFDEIKKEASKKNKTMKYHIVELGCGSGRFVQQKQFSELKNIKYTGVDISQQLLKFAQETYPKGHFIHTTMLDFIKEQKQESVDLILAFASFQHIPSVAEREILMHYFYQTPHYGGTLAMTNWALSDWFRKQYAPAVRKSWVKHLYTIGRSDHRDIFVPWKGHEEHHRYYHLFSLKELEKLARKAGFVIEQLDYIDKFGHIVDSAKTANNSLLIARKSVFND